MGHIKKTLSEYSSKGTLRLHMPGHKGSLNALDLTELPQTGDLNRPSGPYKKAADFLSQTYNSQKSFFLTCGATSGIRAMVCYAKNEGRTVVAARNSHMSVINACLLFGADCEIVEPEYSEETDSYKSPSDAFIKFLNTTKKKCAVIVTHPDYFGRCTDMCGIRAAADKSGALLFCDEAHGAHFIYSEALPDSAGRYSDIWVHGAHKTLGAATQGAFVHLSQKVDADLFGRILRALNTSSPSHTIAASLEDAVILSSGGAWNRRAEECEKLEAQIGSLKYMKCAGAEWARSAGYKDKDPTRVVIDAKNAGGGFYLYKKLYEDFNIQMEAADFRYAVAIMTNYDANDCDIIFYQALRGLDKEMPEIGYPAVPSHPERVLSMNEAHLAAYESIELEKAEGRVSADILGAYPPGTALVLPGEKIEARHIGYFEKIMRLGGSTFGIENGRVAVCRI